MEKWPDRTDQYENTCAARWRERAVPGEGTQIYPRKNVTNSDAPFTIELVRKLHHVNVGWAYEQAIVGEETNTQLPEEFQELLEESTI